MKKKLVLAMMMGMMAVTFCACEGEMGDSVARASAKENTNEVTLFASDDANEDIEEDADLTDSEDSFAETLWGDAVEDTGEDTDAVVDENAGESLATDDAANVETTAGSVENESQQDTGTADASANTRTVPDEEVTEDPDANVASLETCEGEFTGWIDEHTVEVSINGVLTGFAVADESVKNILNQFEENTIFTFEVERDGALKTIVKVIGG